MACRIEVGVVPGPEYISTLSRFDEDILLDHVVRGPDLDLLSSGPSSFFYINITKT